MRNVVLLGDSILDNRAYVPSKQAVTDQLAGILPNGAQVTLLAVDGSITAQVVGQLGRLPSDATDVFVSSGGNDALRTKFQIFEPDGGLEVMDVLQVLTQNVQDFREEYRRLMNALEDIGIPVSVLTIYDSIPGLQEVHKTALSVFNDVIIHEASRKGFAIIDIRGVCTAEDDYSEMSPIEPSAKGGMKIVECISALFERPHSVGKRSIIY
jgi:hypothetical protein